MFYLDYGVKIFHFIFTIYSQLISWLFGQNNLKTNGNVCRHTRIKYTDIYHERFPTSSGQFFFSKEMRSIKVPDLDLVKMKAKSVLG